MTIDTNPIIVALDVPELSEAVELARRLQDEVGYFKVGLELFAAHGPEAVAAIGKFGDVFLDVKLHDIPTTVERAARQLGRLGVALITVHALGGKDMIAAAVEGSAEGAKGRTGPHPRILAVTVLTSLSDDDLAAVGLPPAEDAVIELGSTAVNAGAPGLVCAPRDVSRLRQEVGGDPLLVTPGIRPADSGHDDHARAATPAEAISAGADLLVVGRPITRAPDPVAAARSILAEVSA